MTHPGLGQPISVAIETTCRAGGVALGAGDVLVEVLPFDAAYRAATQTVGRLAELLSRHGLAPADVQELYVSAGPGSFTGTRVGLTVARTLAQAIGAVRCVGVPTVRAVARAAEDWPGMDHLAVVLDARQGRVFWAAFDRGPDGLTPVQPGRLGSPRELLEQTPRPLYLCGEGLAYHDLRADGVTALPEDRWLPRVECVWAVGRQLAAAGQTVDYLQLLPLYTGQPEAVRKWDNLP